VVLISLTEKGVKAYHHHANFHDEMIKATLNGLNEEQTKVLVKALTNLSAFFRTYGK
jgi:DNA-binding MarR family transcriptional regulator